jgi:hypothetical protein
VKLEIWFSRAVPKEMAKTFQVLFFTTFIPAALAQDAFPTNSFELVSGQAGNVQYFYERSLASASNSIHSAFTGFLATAQQRSREVDGMKSQTAELVKEVDGILGVKTNSMTFEERETILRTFLSFKAYEVVAVSKTSYVLTDQGIKEKLRAGVHLPYFTYDRKNDLVTYALQFGSPLIDDGQTDPAASSPAKPSSDYAFLVFPVPDAASAADNLTNYFGGFLVDIRGPALHELIELEILRSVHFADVFYRWFSDGFANALTEHILLQRCGPEAAGTFAGYFDPAACSIASNVVTLRWWMPNKRLIDPATMEQETELQKARYAYATALARRIIREAGIGSVRGVIGTLARKTNVYSQDIEEAIHAVTQLDVKSLLDQYQPFASVEDGLQLYTNRVNQKIKMDATSKPGQSNLTKEDKDEIVFNCLRIAELQMARHRELEPAFCGHLAQFIDGLGFSHMAIEFLRNQIRLMDLDGRAADKSRLEQEFIKFAWNTENMPVVFTLADDLLKTAPNDPGALSVEMFKQVRVGNAIRARTIAQTILANPRTDSFFHDKATSLLMQR